DDGQDRFLPDEVLVTLVVGVNRQGRVAEHRLRTGGGDAELPVAAGDGVFDGVDLRVELAELHFHVRDGRLAVRAPVDHGQVAVDQPVVVERDEDVPDGAREPLV